MTSCSQGGQEKLNFFPKKSNVWELHEIYRVTMKPVASMTMAGLSPCVKG